jgi:hypothetical protein
MYSIEIKRWSEREGTHSIDIESPNECTIVSENEGRVYNRRFNKWKSLYNEDYAEYRVALMDDNGMELDAFTCHDIDFI